MVIGLFGVEVSQPCDVLSKYCDVVTLLLGCCFLHIWRGFAIMSCNHVLTWRSFNGLTKPHHGNEVVCEAGGIIMRGLLSSRRSGNLTWSQSFRGSRQLRRQIQLSTLFQVGNITKIYWDWLAVSEAIRGRLGYIIYYKQDKYKEIRRYISI